MRAPLLLRLYYPNLLSTIALVTSGPTGALGLLVRGPRVAPGALKNERGGAGLTRMYQHS